MAAPAPQPVVAVVSCAVRPTDLDTTALPKALLPIAGQPLIKHCITQLMLGGVTHVVLVLGFHGQLIREMILPCEEFSNLTIDVVDLGDAWRAGFCPSLLAAQEAVKADEFLICTYDHVFDQGAVRQMVNAPTSASGTVVLADKTIPEDPELAAARNLLKVVGDESSVMGVEADKADANAVEAGLFKTTRAVFQVIKELSEQKPYFRFVEVLRELSGRGNLTAHVVPDLVWFPIETEAQLKKARQEATAGHGVFHAHPVSLAPGQARRFISSVSSDPEAIDRLPEGAGRVFTRKSGEEDTKVNICLVGLGRAGQFHLKSISMLTSKVRLRWVVDVDEGVLAKVTSTYDCKGTTNLDVPLADPEVEAVIIASTTFLHYEHIIRSLKAGKAVLAEKPISHDPTELKHVLDTALEKKLPFLAGYQRRCDKNFRDLKAQMVSGHIGGTRVIKCTSRDNPEPPLEYLRISGGIFHDMLCHDFDMIHYLTGQFPESVYSVGHTYNQAIADMDDVDTAVVTLQFASGLLATVDTSRIAAYGYDQRIEVFGDKGMCQAHNMSESSIMLATVDGYRTPRSEWSFPQRYPQAYLTELAEFVEMVRDWIQEEESTVMRHLMLEKVTTAAELSYRLKRPVRIDEVEGLRDKLPKH